MPEAHHHADALGRLFGQLVAGGQTGVPHGLHRSGQPVMDEGVHAGLLWPDVLVNLEALDLSREMTGQDAGVKAGDGGNAERPGQDVGLQSPCCPQG